MFGVKLFLKSKIAKSQPLLSKLRVHLWKHTDELQIQIDRHFEHLGLDNAIIHSHRMIEQIRKIGCERRSRVLAVGCCNMIEIHAFKSYGYDDVVGVDLVSSDPQFIKVMDMHSMAFENHSFDVLYSSGTFHCTYDPSQLAAEFVRVVKRGGVLCITVPIDFTPSRAYPYDPGSLAGLSALFEKDISETLWSEIVPANSEFNPNGNSVLRVIFRLK